MARAKSKEASEELEGVGREHTEMRGRTGCSIRDEHCESLYIVATLFRIIQAKGNKHTGTKVRPKNGMN